MRDFVRGATGQVRGKGEHRPLVVVSLILLAVYLLAYGGRFHVIDEVSIYALAENMAKRGALDTDQILWSQWARPPKEVQGDFGRGGHVYSQKGFPTAMLPALLVRLVLPFPTWGLVFAAFLANGIVTALTAYVLGLLVRALGYGKRSAALVALTFGLATLALPYARLLFGEPVAALMLVLTAYALRRGRVEGSTRWVWWGGLAFAASIWTRSANVILLPAFALYLMPVRRPRTWEEVRAALRLALPFVACALICGVGGFGLYNALRFGVPWKTGYQVSLREAFTTPPWVGAYGLLLSPFRGLVWFSPVVLAVIPGYRRFRRAHGREAYTYLALFLLYLLFYSTWWSWSGEFTWGPRFLLPVLPLLLVMLAPLWERWPPPRWLVGLGGLSLGVQFLAVAADFTLAETVLEMEFGEPKFAAAVLFDPRWSPVVLQAKHLAQGFWDLGWVHVGRPALPTVALALAVVVTGGWALARGRLPRLLPLALIVMWGLAATLGIRAMSDWARARPFDANVFEAAQVIQQKGTPDDVLITLAPFDYASVMNWVHAPVYTLGMAPHPAPLRPEEARLLARAATREEGVIWLLAARLPPAHPEALAEAWLSKTAFVWYHQWFGELRLVGFAPPMTNRDEVTIWRWTEPPSLEGGITLQMMVADAAPRAGQPLRVGLTWRTRQPLSTDYTTFVHLLTRDGRYVAGFDGPPQNGYAPTSTWAVNAPIADYKAIRLPRDLPPGEYALEVGMYDPATGQRLAVTLEGKTDSRLLIAPVVVGAAQP